MTLDAEDIQVIEQMLHDLLQRIMQGRDTQMDAAFLASLSDADYDAIMEPRFRRKNGNDPLRKTV